MGEIDALVGTENVGDKVKGKQSHGTKSQAIKSQVNKKVKFLYRAVSNPQDCSKRFTPSLTDLFTQTPPQLLWELIELIQYTQLYE